MGYFDRKPRIRSHEEMMDVLKQRSKEQIAPPPPDTRPLDWIPRNTGEARIRTACGRYSIDAVREGDIWYFIPWREHPKECLGRSDSSLAAKKICEDDKNS